MRILHANRVFHRDLKPDNVLLTKVLEPKLTDFGLAKRVAVGASLNQSDTRGTPLFMAPEIHVSHNYGFPADVYAFGVIAYAASSGLPLFPGLTFFQLATAVTEGKRPPVLHNELFSEDAKLLKLIRLKVGRFDSQFITFFFDDVLELLIPVPEGIDCPDEVFLRA
jgi:serine/threonine protein kinase